MLQTQLYFNGTSKQDPSTEMFASRHRAGITT